MDDVDGGGDTSPLGASGDAASLDWAEVRRAYELTGEAVTSIETRFGLTRYELTKRRRAEDWTTRPPVARRTGLPKPKATGSEAVALRLNRLLVIGIAMLEKRLAEEGLTDANARTLTELCRAEELRMRSTRQKTGKTREMKNHDDGYDFRDDPAWLDAEFKRRLDRRFGAERAGGDLRGDDGGGEAGVSGGLAKGMGAG
jgi:hypothetical protein